MAGTAPWAVPPPRRARNLIPTGVPRRRELIAVGAVAILAAHLLLAQLTLVLAVAFAVASKASRWRLWWLLWPAAVGLAWMIAVGPTQAIAGFTAGPSAILWHLSAGHLAGRQPLGGFGGAQHWLPRQFPVALIAGAVEAALIGWLDWLHTDEWAVPPPRPGLIATARRAVALRAVRAGAVVTREGCALGIVAGTGAVAEISWAEAVHGTLVVGAAERDVALAGLQVVHAALRRRKPVIVLDLGSDVAWAVRAACLATGVPLRTAGPSQTMGAAGAAGYAAAGGGGRLQMPIGKAQPAGASGLWGRNAGRESQADGPAPADLGRVLREREAALFTAELPEQASHACAELASLACDLRRIGVDGDALVWVPRGERVPAAALGELLGQAPEAGLSVLIGTTSPAESAELSALVGTVLVHRVTDQGLAASLAARTGTRLLPRSLAGSGNPAGFRYPAAAPVGFAPADGRPAGVAPAGAAPAGAALPSARLADTVAAVPDLNLVPSPVVAARTLLTLGQSEFVLAVSRPRHRIIAPGLMVPARLPPPAEHAAEHQAGHHPPTGRRTGRPPAGREAGA